MFCNLNCNVCYVFRQLNLLTTIYTNVVIAAKRLLSIQKLNDWKTFVYKHLQMKNSFHFRCKNMDKRLINDLLRCVNRRNLYKDRINDLYGL